MLGTSRAPRRRRVFAAQRLIRATSIRPTPKLADADELAKPNGENEAIAGSNGESPPNGVTAPF